MKSFRGPVEDMLEGIQEQVVKNAKDKRGQAFHDEVQRAVTGYQIPIMDISKVYRAAEAAFDSGKNVTEAVHATLEALGVKKNEDEKENAAFKVGDRVWVHDRSVYPDEKPAKIEKIEGDRAYVKWRDGGAAWTGLAELKPVKNEEEDEKKENVDEAAVEKYAASLTRWTLDAKVRSASKNFGISYDEAYRIITGEGDDDDVDNSVDKSGLQPVLRSLSDARSIIMDLVAQADVNEKALLKKASDGVISAINALTQLK